MLQTQTGQDKMSRLKLISFALLSVPHFASAEVELSFYGGVQQANASEVTFSGDPVIADGTHSLQWVGKPFEAPPYYGIRATYWQTPEFGYGLDFTHNKVYPTDDSLPTGITRLEFTDGLNTLTFNAYRRWNGALGNFSPYVGGGLGLSIPHVEVTSGTSETAGYQITGAAATWIAGASYPINDEWSVFGEYKGTYSENIGDLDTGGTVDTDIVTNALNLGVSFNF